MTVLEASRAAVAVSPLETEIQEFSLPEIPPDAGLLKVDATGICGSDWGMYQRKDPGPRILGHEMVGTIVALGDIARDKWGVSEGDVVALEEYLPCGYCEYCRSGEYRSCLSTDSRIPGSIRYGSTPVSRDPSLWGGYSQYLYMHPRTVLHQVPDGVPNHIAAMALPIGNGFQWAVMDGSAGPGKSILIQGPGQQGLGSVIGAASAGADLIIVSGLAKDKHRLDVALELGAHHVVMVDEQNLAAEVERLTNGRMLDIVLEVSGAGPEVINDHLGLLRKRGIMQIAARKGSVADFDMNQIINKQITFKGLRGHSYDAVELALGAMATGRLPLEKMSSHVIGLKDLDHALRMVGGEADEPSIHITVEPWKE